MRHRSAGKVTEGLWYLGRVESGVYLLESENESAIINGALSYVLPDALAQMEQFGLDANKITKMIILHAHFDHVGIFPYFARKYPQIKVYGSARAGSVMKMPNAIDTINSFSQIAIDIAKRSSAMASFDTPWRDDITVETISEGDVISVGKRALQVMETPGHSACSISLYEPSIKALFASDGNGIPFEDTIVASGNSNYTQFQENLKKLSTFAVDFLCADHYGYVSGVEAHSFTAQTIEAAAQFRGNVESAYIKLGDIDAATKEINNTFYNAYPSYFLEKSIMEGVIKQMVKHIVQGIK